MPGIIEPIVWLHATGNKIINNAMYEPIIICMIRLDKSAATTIVVHSMTILSKFGNVVHWHDTLFYLNKLVYAIVFSFLLLLSTNMHIYACSHGIRDCY